MQSTWIPLDKIQPILGIEGFFVAWISIPIAFIFYIFFLKKITEKRHYNLRTRFKEVPWFLLISTVLTLIQYYLIDNFPKELLLYRAASYIALIALLVGAMAIIKIAQIYIYLYLFFSNMSHGVPKLLANMFTFIFSLIIANMMASSVFEIHLSALLATSAVFSLVMGLALQDTLGNLFAGVSLQIESPFKIGDWIEVHSGDEKWLGQVQEITWRATFLISFADELIMIPNRTISQSQIIIISQGNKNIRLNQVFRFPYSESIEKAKNAIREGISEVEGIMTDPPIRILIIETNESWVAIKVFYSLVDFSTRYRIGDQIITKILTSIQRNGIKMQSPRVELIKE
ncbi:MAG: mechanosensitive ion channel family protein [Bacteriovorax sp.]|nr:mechanosensitive ion channel family protein [Bacteriovorax sp.]